MDPIIEYISLGYQHTLYILLIECITIDLVTFQGNV